MRKETINKENSNGSTDREKYSQIIDDMLKNISILSNLLNTDEFQKLTTFSTNLNSNKKKLNRDPLTLNLNEDNNNITINVKADKNLTNKSRKFNKSKHAFFFRFSNKKHFLFN